MLNRFETARLTVPQRDRTQDRIGIIHQNGRTVIVVADGAGGTGSGDVAAETVIRECEALIPEANSSSDWTVALRQIDQRISSGESTAVVVDIRPDHIFGASVGDSQAWHIDAGDLSDLTIHQNRKPLLGSRAAEPTGFDFVSLRGILLVATDGFCNYVKRDKVVAMSHQSDFFELPRKCLEMVRLPSGELWDDMSVVVCRAKPIARTRKRYEI